jgi:hypothetical protein
MSQQRLLIILDKQNYTIFNSKFLTPDKNRRITDGISGKLFSSFITLHFSPDEEERVWFTHANNCYDMVADESFDIPERRHPESSVFKVI